MGWLLMQMSVTEMAQNDSLCQKIRNRARNCTQKSICNEYAKRMFGRPKAIRFQPILVFSDLGAILRRYGQPKGDGDQTQPQASEHALRHLGVSNYREPHAVGCQLNYATPS